MLPLRRMGVEAIYRRPRTTQPHPGHRDYPYLLRDKIIDQPNQVWAMDITYLPMKRGFVYLVAVLDWSTRKVLAWQLSNTLTADFCVEALEIAFERYGVPEIVNTDQGSQFTNEEFVEAVGESGAKLSMDGKGLGVTIFSSSDSGGRSNTKKCIYAPMRTWALLGAISPSTWISTMVDVHTVHWRIERRMRCTSDLG